MEIVLIGILVAMCWAVWRASTATDRSRKSYAARHLLGPLPEADRSRRGGSAGSAQAKPENPSWAIPATAMETVDLFDDDWFPPFDNWRHPGRLPYFDYSDSDDMDSTSPLSPLYTDDINEPFETYFHHEDAGQGHVGDFDDT